MSAEDIQDFLEKYETFRAEVGKVIVGNEEIIDDVVATMLARGHALLEGPPGVAKTLMCKTVAKAFGLTFRRIQFTPDLMPADITGTNVILDDPESGRRCFEFHQGPIFANIVLADEINRATPKTQSALLEAMQEQQVTVGGESHALPRPFFVLATQNPIELQGTYPLPEAQLDRFCTKLLIPYPNQLEEILKRTTGEQEQTTDDVRDVMGGDDMVRFQQLTRLVLLADELNRYVVRVVKATHPEILPESSGRKIDVAQRFLRYGCSPRGAQSVILCAKAYALMAGRANVSSDDLRRAFPLALRHRLILNFEAEAARKTADEIIQEILEVAA